LRESKEEKDRGKAKTSETERGGGERETAAIKKWGTAAKEKRKLPSRFIFFLEINKPGCRGLQSRQQRSRVSRDSS
jgi:hypothetical protein